MRIDLAGKTALVTGSTRGIGAAIATGLARAGARVAVNGRSHESVDKALDELRDGAPGADFIGLAGDVATEEGARAVIDALPRTDILINNLGVFGAEPALEITDDEWRRYFETNVLSGVRLTRAYLPGMSARGFGRVQYIASDSAIVIPAEMIHYGVSKTSLLAVARGSRRPRPVRVSRSTPCWPGRPTPVASRGSSARWSATNCRGTRRSGSSCGSTARSRCSSG